MSVWHSFLKNRTQKSPHGLQSPCVNFRIMCSGDDELLDNGCMMQSSNMLLETATQEWVGAEFQLLTNVYAPDGTVDAVEEGALGSLFYAGLVTAGIPERGLVDRESSAAIRFL